MILYHRDIKPDRTELSPPLALQNRWLVRTLVEAAQTDNVRVRSYALDRRFMIVTAHGATVPAFTTGGPFLGQSARSHSLPAPGVQMQPTCGTTTAHHVVGARSGAT